MTGWLSRCAKSRINHSQAQIIGVTGSVGKTTTKDALAFVLGEKYKILANKKSFNSEIGLPLAILGESTAVRPWDWFGIAYRAWNKRNQPLDADYIILEMGVDTPGDMDYLLGIVQPSLGIFIHVAPVHLAPGQFGSLDQIAEEKGKLITSLPASGLAILNHSDDLVWQFSQKTSAGVISFGEGGDFAPQDITQDQSGLHFQIQNQQFDVPLVGRHHAELFSAVCALCTKLELSLAEIAQALSNFHLEPGRMSLLPGINNSTLIDGSYNSNPASAQAAIDALADFPGRRIAVLGQMNELGAQSERYHRALGEYLQGKVDLLIGVYGDAKYICEELDKTGQNVQYYQTSPEAGEYLKSSLKSGDIVLFKGSQNNVRLEKAVKLVLADPTQASELLCRQGAEWQD